MLLLKLWKTEKSQLEEEVSSGTSTCMSQGDVPEVLTVEPNVAQGKWQVD